jgi:pilus assembly protein Flp/PilA
MNNKLVKACIKIQTALHKLASEEGQDLVEYALVVALIAFAAIAGMGTLANDINTAFTNIGTTLTASV